MAKTANSFNSSLGELVFGVTAGDITAIGAPLVTAEEIIIDGSVVSFKEVTNQARPTADMHVLGDVTPIVGMSDHVNSAVYEIVLVDDYHLGAAGEYGTDLLSAVELFLEYFNNSPRQNISNMSCTPAGGSTGHIETTLTAPIKIESISEPEMDAAKAQVETVTVRVRAAGKTKAVHA